ncbi:MAG: hypothetical protein E4H01_07545 [Lysobacterales bacterium]|nr:MAG: hypothetical protein E4H01_07545 [Xanthomonadales bacterium]
MVSMYNNDLVCPVCSGIPTVCGGVDTHIETIEECLIEIDLDHYLQGIVKGLEMGVKLVQSELEKQVQKETSQGMLQALGRVDAMVKALEVERTLNDAEDDVCDCDECRCLT